MHLIDPSQKSEFFKGYTDKLFDSFLNFCISKLHGSSTYCQYEPNFTLGGILGSLGHLIPKHFLSLLLNVWKDLWSKSLELFRFFSISLTWDWILHKFETKEILVHQHYWKGTILHQRTIFYPTVPWLFLISILCNYAKFQKVIQF